MNCTKHEIENLKDIASDNGLTVDEYEQAMEELHYLTALADIAYFAKVKGLHLVFRDILNRIESNSTEVL